MNKTMKDTKVRYEFYMQTILNMNLDGFAYKNGKYYTIIKDCKVSIFFDMDDRTYNIVTERIGIDEDDTRVITWDWNPDVKHVYRILLQHIQDVYTKFAK